VGAAVLVLMAAAAAILSANATLTQNPGAWTGFRAAAGLRPYLGGATFWPRWAAALGGLAGGGGLFVATLACIRDRQGDGSAWAEVRRALAVSAAGLAVLLAGGMWAGLALSPAEVRAAVLSGPESVFAWAAMAAVAVALLLVLVALARPALWNLMPACGLVFLGALALAAARDTARRAALALGDCYHLSDVPVHPQWTSLGLFAAVFVLGLALVAYLVRMARQSAAGSGRVL